MARQLTFEDYLEMRTAEQGKEPEVASQLLVETNNDNKPKFTWKPPTLLEKIIDYKNLEGAYRHVYKRKGSPGIDGVTVDDDELFHYILTGLPDLRRKIMNRKYKPQPVKRVLIPKDTPGEFRKLGIPVVLDRVVQQAIAQELIPLYEPKFSEYSFGFRPERGCHDAIKQVLEFANQGYDYVISLDLEKYFDTVNQQKLIQILQKVIKDNDVISLIHKFLKAGVVENGLFQETNTGMPQGGNLSPVLSNIMLNELDMELEKRGHKFVRYADDTMILCKSRKAAERTRDSIIKFIEKDLKLKVNRKKTTIAKLNDGIKYLGFGFQCRNGQYEATAHKKSKKKLKENIKKILRRNTPYSFEYIRDQLADLIRGWVQYFKIARIRSFLKEIDKWMRHRIRALIWKRWKKPASRFKYLVKLGMDKVTAWNYANTSKGIWAASAFKEINFIFNNKRLARRGYLFFITYYDQCEI